MAAQACAKLANACVGKLLRAESALVLEGLHGEADMDRKGETHGEPDAVFLVLSLLSDVLKHARKRDWSYGDYKTQVKCKRKRNDDTRDPRVVSPSLKSILPAATSAGGTSSGPAFGEIASAELDVADLAEAVTAVPVGRGTGTVDVALKWLEVTQARALCQRSGGGFLLPRFGRVAVGCTVTPEAV